MKQVRNMPPAKWGKLGHLALCCAIAAMLVLLPACNKATQEDPGQAAESESSVEAGEEDTDPIQEERSSPDESALEELDVEPDTFELDIDQALDLANDSFAPVPEYDYLGMAYFLDDEGGARGVYIPYGEDTRFERQRVFSKNHGVSITVYLTRQYDDAADALSNLTFSIPVGKDLEDMAYHDIGGSTMDNDTVGLRMFAATGTRYGEETLVFQVNYADIRDDGYYLIALITLYPEEYDGETPALIDDINDCYAITIPADEAVLWRLVESSK